MYGGPAAEMRQCHLNNIHFYYYYYYYWLNFQVKWTKGVQWITDE